MEDNRVANLLRVVIGFLHVSLSQQTALTRFGKPLHTLTDKEKMELQNGMISEVMLLARQVSDETVANFLKIQDTPMPPGPVH